MKTRRRATFLHLFFQIWQIFNRVSNLDGKDEAAVCTVGGEELPLVWRAWCSEGRQDWKVVREAVWGRIITTQFLENGDFWRACQIWCYDAVSDLMHNWVAQRPDFKSALRVVKMVLNTQCYQYLWLTMWFHAKKSKETLKNSKSLILQCKFGSRAQKWPKIAKKTDH